MADDWADIEAEAVVARWDGSGYLTTHIATALRAERDRAASFPGRRAGVLEGKADIVSLLRTIESEIRDVP